MHLDKALKFHMKSLNKSVAIYHSFWYPKPYEIHCEIKL